MAEHIEIQRILILTRRYNYRYDAATYAIAMIPPSQSLIKSSTMATVPQQGNRKKVKLNDPIGDPDDPDLLGVSVQHLCTIFMALVHAKHPDSGNDTTIYKIEDLRELDKNGIIREKGKDTQCPIDGEKGAAYVHTLQGADHVGPASIMLSYTWRYTIGDIVDVLTNYCESNSLNPKEVYVWICCLCVNQHRVVEMKKRKEDIPFEKFRKVFHGRVTSIGHVIAMMSPWLVHGHFKFFFIPIFIIC